MENGSIWGIATIVGPIILLAAIAWAIIRNKQSRVPKDVTESATKRLYEAEDRDPRNADD